jgi:uncharacterized membrane protein
VHHVHDLPVSGRVRRQLNLTAAALALLTVVGIVVLRPGGEDRPDLAEFGVAAHFYDARVVEVEHGPCPRTAPGVDIVCDVATVELLGGPDEGDTVDLEFPESVSNPDLRPGDKIVLNYEPAAGPGFEYQFADRQRKPVLFWLAASFALAVVVLGRLRGLAALAGLAASLAVLLAFALPALIDGRMPIAVAVVAAAAISYFALYLAHGFTAMTTVALLGTLASLALTAVLAVTFDGLARFSGFATEEAGFLAAAGTTIDVGGLLLAGVVIGALGAIDDMTVTQASAVAELHAANPALGTAELLRRGLRIGRDHVASTVNTLVLAYAGASMPLLVLFVLSEQSLASVANSEVVAVEIVRTLVGSIGLVASVPLTTWLAAQAIRPDTPRT